jgi:CheY-like chemotaxis protein/tRNA A-37 threonylcarbamoyl transferase component Bud32
LTPREEFVQGLIDSELIPPAALWEFIQQIPPSERPTHGEALARVLVTRGMLTKYQADAVLERKFDRLSIGQYQVLEQIGSGGMGAVYKARHRRMNRIVAIKMLTRRLEMSADAMQRFEREVQLLSGLHHPNIVIAYDADECSAGLFLVMEHVAGQDLESTVQKGGPLSVAAALDCTVQSARGLQYAHEQGVIHRDIKPGNLLRANDTGSIKITDLGIARLKDEPGLRLESAPSLTDTGRVLGTVYYMAPEQGIDAKTADHRADVYSLGCTLYFLLHGMPQFEGETLVDTIMLHRNGPIPSLALGRPDVPESLDRVFQKMVAKLPDDRFQSMSDVLSALQACQLDPISSARPVFGVAAPSAEALINAATFGGDAPAPAGASVLLVEPSSAQVVVIRGLLEALGMGRIERCRTGTEALQAFSQFGAEVVISAMHLDDMTGLELAQQMPVAAQGGRIRFVLISSTRDARYVQDQARRMGLILLPKPFDDQQLAAALHEAAVGTGSI